MILITKIFNEIDKKDCVIKAHLNALNILIKKVIIISDYDDIKINNSKISLLHNRRSEVETLQYIIKSFPNETIIWSDSHTLFDSILSNFKNLPISQSNILYTKNVIIFNTNVKFVKSDSLISSLIGNRIDISSQIEKGYNKPRKELPNITTKNIVRKIPNESIKISKIETIIVSVDYNDVLIISLENNIKYLDSITVVTSTKDTICQEICKKFGVNCVITDSMYENGAKFNKGKAINVGIRSLKKPDWVLLLDADILLTYSIDKDTLDKNNLYTSSRYICDYESYKKWSNGEIEISEIGYLEENKGFGFFHLYNVNNRNVYHRVFGILFPEKSNDAGWSDVSFRNNFKSSKSIEKDIIHIGQTGVNWSGRKSEKVITELYKSMYKSTYTICSYYFNFKNDIRQKNNFIKFLEQFKDHYDNMIVGIIDYGDIDFEIPCKSIIIKGDVNNKLWSKEILINKIIDKVDTDYLLWIDGDLIYNNLDWLDNIDTIVGGNDFVQLFEDINYLGENNELLESHKSIISNGGKNIDSLLVKGYKPGGSWLGKVSILKDKKLFEKMYVGGGDTIFTYGLFNINNGFTLGKIGEGSKEIQNDATEWINRFGEYKVGYLNETVNHLYHGNLKDRNYNDRYIELKCKEFEYDFCIIITTYNRPEMLRYLLDDIEFNSLEKRVLVTVFDDGSDTDYNYLDKYDIKYVKYIKNNGKMNYWKLVSDTFKYCGKIKSKYYIYLPDDVRLKNNFFEESVRIFEKIEDENKICLNLLMDESRRGNPNWTGFTPIEYDEYYKTQWNDLCFISKFDFFKKINFEILPINKNRWLKNSELGSGVGQQMSTRLINLDQNMYHVVNSLVTHGGHESQMNYEDRKKVKLIAK